jgi:glycosyltransferase involved in cell wall biosynthesis
MNNERKLRLAFLLDWNLSEGSQLATAEDGHWEMIYLLQKEWIVQPFVCLEEDGIPGAFPHKYFDIFLERQSHMAQTIYDFKPDVILVWGDLTRPTLKELVKNNIPVFLCFAGGGTEDITSVMVRGIFVESAVYENLFKARGLNVMRAFGVNERIFKPIKQPKVWDAIFPATFADWKRHQLFADSVENGFCFGYMYHTHEQWCWQYPQEKNMLIAPHIPSEAVAYFMNAAHSCLITSNASGGSQRTVLESMACNIPPIVMSDSDKTREYVEDSGFGFVVEPNPEAIKRAIVQAKEIPFPDKGRKYIESKWTANHFKEAIKKGILESL